MSTGYYQKNKKRLQKRLLKCIKIFLQKKKTKNKIMVASYVKEKHKKHQYERECYESLSEDKKQRLVEYKKSYYTMRK